MLVGFGVWTEPDRLHVLQGGGAIRLRDEPDEAAADELVAAAAEIAAVGVVDERQRGVRQVAADQLCLGLDHVAVAFLAFPQRFLGKPPPARLKQQRDDERRLQDDDRDHGENLLAVPLPQGQLPEADDRAGRQSRFVQPPSPQLPPVDHEGLGLDLLGRQTFRRSTRQDAQANAGGRRADGHEAVHVAADDPLTEVGLVDAIHGGSGSIGNSCRQVARDEALTRSVLEDREIDHDGALRLASELVQQLRQRQARQIGHLEPVGVGPQLFAGRRLPALVEVPGPGHHDDLPGIRLQSQRQLQRLHRIEAACDPRRVRRQRQALEAALADAGEDHWNSGKQGRAALDEEIQRLWADCDRQLDRDRRIFVAQPRLHAGFVRRPREPVSVEGLGEDFDAVGISGREVRLNAGAEGNAGRQQALVREQHQDPLRLGRRGIRSEEHQNRERDQPWRRAPA